MKNLGKIVLFTLFFPTLIFAGVSASISPLAPQEGELVRLSLEIEGRDAKVPQITRICDAEVISTGQHTNLQMLGGITKKVMSYSYEFFPTKSCEIPSFEIEVDGVLEKTKAIKLNITPVKRTKDQPFLLTLESSKKEVYVGEPFELELIFRQRSDIGIVDSEFSPPKLQGFWMHGDPKQEQYKENGFSITKLYYKLSAQRDANLSIEPAQIKIATRSSSRDPWGSWIPRLQWKTYRSNALSIDVKAIPQGLKYIGDFSIEASVDKQSLEANEALNLTLRVQGEGNLEDISFVKPSLDGVSVFEEKSRLVDGVLEQKMAFVAERDFVIPSFVLEYFDPKTQSTKQISTKEFSIKVHNKAQKSELVIQKAQDQKESTQEVEQKTQNSLVVVILSFIFGVFVGVALMLLWQKRGVQQQSRKKLSLDDEKALIVKLLPYRDDSEVQEFLDLLEENIYSKEKKNIDKKRLKALLERYS